MSPSQFTDFLGLKGDKADNIPGVPGIGDKKAASMLQAYGNLEGIYANLDKFKGKQLENLTNHRDDAFLSREIATIVRDADIDIDLESLSFPDFDPKVVSDAFTAVRFMAHLNKVLDLVGSELPVTEAAQLAGWEHLVRGDEAHAAVDAALAEAPDDLLGVAWRLDGQDSLFGSSLTLAVHVGDRTALFSGSDAEEETALLVREAYVAVFDAKGFLSCAFPPDTSREAKVSPGEVLEAQLFDVALAGYVVDSNNGASTLQALMELYAGVMLPEAESGSDEELALHAAATAALVEPLSREMDAREVRNVYENIDLPLVGVLACMERTGAAIDSEHLASLAKCTGAEIERLRQEIYVCAGEEFNVDSPKQLSGILFDKIGLTPVKKTRSGYSTDARVLKELSGEHELPGLVLSYREYAKVKSTYIDALPKMMRGDGRVHTSFNEMVTTTGRLSSSDPNLQNIPVRTEFGRQIRTCFVPLHEGKLFLGADYSQIELRLLAHLSGDEHLIDAFRSGEDFHARTASRVFGVPVDEVTPQLRSRAKAVNFGIVYGQQAFGLSQSLEIPFFEAKEMIDRYFEAYPQVRLYLDDVVARAHADGFATTMYGRRRYIPELKSRSKATRSFGERTAVA